jgi:hypothetical protein
MSYWELPKDYDDWRTNPHYGKKADICTRCGEVDEHGTMNMNKHDDLVCDECLEESENE